MPALLEGFKAEALLTELAYDSDKMIQSAQAQGMQIVIPSKVNRKIQRPLDKACCEARHLVENLFQRMEVFRRVATRFDKLDTRYPAQTSRELLPDDFRRLRTLAQSLLVPCYLHSDLVWRGATQNISRVE